MTMETETSGWAVGWTFFAAAMMMVIGVYHGIAGLVGIFENELYVRAGEYILELDATTWGWTHLVLGIVVFLAGLGLLSGATWARIVGVILAILSMIANFAFLPWYPLWAAVMIAVNTFVIWALTVHGDDITMR